MATEIERKFRLSGEGWRAATTASTLLRQGYIANTALASVRVRVAGEQAWLSVKSMNRGMSRQEYEYPIASGDAREMLERLCQGALIEKWRHIVPYRGHRWEVDEFLGANAGLVIAELELDAEDAPFDHPPWLGAEVTHDERYYNVRLSEQPFAHWPEQRPLSP